MAFIALALASLREQSGHRVELLAMLFGAAINVIARVAIWRTVYEGQQAVAGITLVQMATYAVFGATLLASWDASMIVRSLGAAIQNGQIGNQLVRPVSFPGALFAQHLGYRIFTFSAVCAPIIIVAFLSQEILGPASFLHGLLFVCYILVSSTLILLTAILFGLLSFWVFDTHSLGWFMRGIVAFLSGGLVPLWFFPSAIAHIARALPFAWMGYYPMAVYLGELDIAVSSINLLWGIGWVICLVSLIRMLWILASRNVVVNGG